jgi:hypothetical protein
MCTMKVVAKKCRLVMCHQWLLRFASSKHGTNSTSHPSSIALLVKQSTVVHNVAALDDTIAHGASDVASQPCVNDSWSDIISLVPGLKRIAILFSNRHYKS